MRSFLFLALMSSTALAAPIADLAKDIDGDGTPDKVVLDSSGELQVSTKRGTEKVQLGAMTKAKLAAAVVKNVPTIIVRVAKTGDVATDGVIVQLAGAGWKQVVRTPIGPQGVDGDYWIDLDARPEGIYRYQARPGAVRCDGLPAYTFAEGLNGTKFQRLSKIPTGIPENASVINAKPEASAPASNPSLFRARFASHQPGAMDAAALAIPTEIDDGNVDTSWREDLTASSGEGQFFTYVSRVPTAKATQLRIVTTKVKGNNRPQRLGVIGSAGAWHVDVPDGAPGSAFTAELTQPISGCVTIIIEATYGAPKGETSIAELAVFAEDERNGGGEKQLAHAVSEGKDGWIIAKQELARRGAAGAAAIEAELSATKDHHARNRLFGVLVTLKDPAAAPLLAKAAKENELQGQELVNAIAALAGTGMAQELADIATTKGMSLDARVAAVRALRPTDAKDRDVLVSLAGKGVREVRHATIENLMTLDVPTLVAAAQAQQDAKAAGDLWRAVTRRAQKQPAERPPALAAMTAALDSATDYERRYRLVDGVATIGDQAALKSLAALLARMPDGADAGAFKHIAARAIAINPRPEAFDLISKLVTDGDAGVRLAALSALAGSSGGAEGAWHGAVGVDGIDRILQTSLLTDTWPDVRRFSAMVLGGRCSRPGPAAALADSLARDKHVGVRGDSLAALVDCKAPGTDELVRKLWDDGKAPLELRRRAVDLTVGLGDAALAQKLVGKFTQWRGAAIESEAALALAQNAAYAIGRLAPPGAAPALQSALDDSAFPEIVGAAATGLGLLGKACPASAKTKLAELAKSDEQQVSSAAARAVAVCGK
ncbi:MAG TPA: HEAT repeat domain-containing protein [Kofleriaceae bacterium]|nr:HEAT repeat domain-containing protein [Kofleriaceae bacterium]